VSVTDLCVSVTHLSCEFLITGRNYEIEAASSDLPVTCELQSVNAEDIGEIGGFLNNPSLQHQSPKVCTCVNVL